MTLLAIPHEGSISFFTNLNLLYTGIISAKLPPLGWAVLQEEKIMWKINDDRQAGETQKSLEI